MRGTSWLGCLNSYILKHKIQREVRPSSPSLIFSGGGKTSEVSATLHAAANKQPGFTFMLVLMALRGPYCSLYTSVTFAHLATYSIPQLDHYTYVALSDIIAGLDQSDRSESVQ